MEDRLISVGLKNNPYDIIIKARSIEQIGNHLQKLDLKKSTKILLITNEIIKKYYLEKVVSSIENSGYKAKTLTIKEGESNKNIKTIELIHNIAYQEKLERGSLIIALGGGVVGDIAGFAAAIWLRGISFIQIPTTLLAMVDSSIGGKTGVNHPKGKNLIGSFHQPKLVVIDPETLRTLPEREFQAGMAEIIKYAVIGDKLLFELLETATSINNLLGMGIDVVEEIIERSAKAKAKVVIKDEREGGLRAILNYGHTFGHVVENLCGYGRYLHGEAVSIGMVAAGELSVIKGLWTRNDALRQKKLLEKAGLPTNWPKLDYKDVISTLKGDKKVKDGKIRFVLASNIGKVEISDNINENDIINCLENLTK